MKPFVTLGNKVIIPIGKGNKLRVGGLYTFTITSQGGYGDIIFVSDPLQVAGIYVEDTTTSTTTLPTTIVQTDGKLGYVKN